ncbi:MAG: hypothetical protein U5R06_12290 [candidate division KSB1 bacterium]|nr:hypothetical protein [candidate division KSB1 bacterium]
MQYCKKIFILCVLMLFIMVTLQCSTEKSDPSVVNFPQVSEPIAITSGPLEHFYASYYGITSWSENQKYATVLQTDIKFRLPTGDDPATLGLVDMETCEFLPLAETRCWNFPAGLYGALVVGFAGDLQ